MIRSNQIKCLFGIALSVEPNQIQTLNYFNLVSSPSMSSDDDEENKERQKQGDKTQSPEAQGWALAENKSAIRYSPDQIRYLTQKYDEGEASSHKWNPSTVACVSSIGMYETCTLASISRTWRPKRTKVNSFLSSINSSHRRRYAVSSLGWPPRDEK